ncbi:hypothetical protein GUJ93_ZPchr0001g29379 [Zizania palustris]|uniref:Uncharacterized protein n=1 Tax=Zizania palustris TaxID=103762 RepID=A0A8J5RZS8_ZIZPA|nr:hypothetical protein GUJ93_ZPchr0001g29379 [Zizania palustris]
MDHGDSWLSEHVTMQLVELEPENVSYYVLLSNLYAKTGRWQESQEILEWMNNKGLRKDAGWSLRMLEDRYDVHSWDAALNMAPPTPRLVVPVDVNKKPWELKVSFHNHWNPDIPPVADVTEGELFYVEMVDWIGGRASDDNSADDIKFGPLIKVDAEGIPASPGDLLAIEICNLGPFPGDEWGYTAIFERDNGGGFLTNQFLSAREVWYFEGIYAYSPKISGIWFPELAHPVLLQRPLANLPTPVNIRCEITRDGMKEYLTPVGPTPLHVDLIFEIGPAEPRFSDWLVFEGISVDESRKQHFLDASVAPTSMLSSMPVPFQIWVFQGAGISFAVMAAHVRVGYLE